MPTFHAEYIPPLPATTEVSDNARAAFQNDGDALFGGLGLRDGGFQANADRVFMLDDRGRLVSAPPYNTQDDKGMTAAAQAGRLYVMDKNLHLRQLRLEGNDDDGYAFTVTKTLKLRQQPRLTMDYFLKRFSAIIDDFVRDMSKNFNQMKDVMSKMREDMSRIFGVRRKETKPAERETTEEPLVSEETLSETISTSKEELSQQTTQSELTTEALLAKSPLLQTTQEFERYLQALDERSNGTLVDAALNKEKGGPNDYYEALAQELEGQVARLIRKAAPGEKEPDARKAFLDKQKPIVATMSKDLRVFVKGQVSPQFVEDFYAQDLQTRSSMRTQLQQKANLIENTGVNAYMKDVLAQNESNRQAMQQDQPSVAQVHQNQPMMELQAPGIGGMGNMR